MLLLFRGGSKESPFLVRPVDLLSGTNVQTSESRVTTQYEVFNTYLPWKKSQLILGCGVTKNSIFFFWIKVYSLPPSPPFPPCSNLPPSRRVMISKPFLLRKILLLHVLVFWKQVKSRQHCRLNVFVAFLIFLLHILSTTLGLCLKTGTRSDHRN